MPIEDNLALVRQAVTGIWNQLDLDLADRVFDPSYVNHGGIIPDLLTGPESMKFAVVLQHTAFPCLEVQERGLAAEGNVVQLRWAATCSQFRGEPGRVPVLVARGTTVIRCGGGRIAESWTTWGPQPVLRSRLQTDPRGGLPETALGMAGHARGGRH